MTPDELKELTSKHLIPLLAAEVEEIRESTPREKCVACLDPNRIAIKADQSDSKRVVLKRFPEFSAEDRKITKCFVSELVSMHSATNPTYIPELLKSLPARAISSYLGGADAVKQILDQFSKWSSCTYEGGAITSAIGIDDIECSNKIDLKEIFRHDFSSVISNGFDTMLVVNNKGDICGSGQLSGGELQIVKAPFRLNLIADWCHGQRIAFVLNRLGEQLIFRNKELVFAKRRGAWQLYSHDIYIKKLHHVHTKRILREAIYESCLDISYARTGGCLIVVDKNCESKIVNIINNRDRIDSDSDPTDSKSKTVKAMVSEPFHKLDRRLRQELLALDGATVINHIGNVIAAGAIICVPSGSDGGGRRAAAQKGSELGMGIKIVR
jgi:hypothetical protein